MANFLMNEERKQELDLSDKCLTPVVSKAKHLRNASLTDEQYQKSIELSARALTEYILLPIR